MKNNIKKQGKENKNEEVIRFLKDRPVSFIEIHSKLIGTGISKDSLNKKLKRITKDHILHCFDFNEYNEEFLKKEFGIEWEKGRFGVKEKPSSYYIYSPMTFEVSKVLFQEDIKDFLENFDIIKKLIKKVLYHYGFFETAYKSYCEKFKSKEFRESNISPFYPGFKFGDYLDKKTKYKNEAWDSFIENEPEKRAYLFIENHVYFNKIAGAVAYLYGRNTNMLYNNILKLYNIIEIELKANKVMFTKMQGGLLAPPKPNQKSY